MTNPTQLSLASEPDFHSESLTINRLHHGTAQEQGKMQLKLSVAIRTITDKT
jgi:hypothetical protein